MHEESAELERRRLAEEIAILRVEKTLFCFDPHPYTDTVTFSQREFARLVGRPSWGVKAALSFIMRRCNCRVHV